MATFFRAQLDYILFFYGLAFVLLGAISFALHRKERRDLHWLMLGVFGVGQGLQQWVEVFAVGLGDTFALHLARLALFAVSFAALIEFWRRSAAQLFQARVGAWVHVPIVLAGILAFWLGGLTGLDVVLRYVMVFIGALGTAFVLFRYARLVDGARRRWLLAASAIFVAYAVANGAVTPAAPFAPAAWLNEESFFATIGMPIQLLRSVLACAMAASLWAYAHSTWWHNAERPRAASARKHFAATAAVLIGLVGLGWVTTEYIGRLSSNELRRDLDADVTLLVRALAAEMSLAERIAQAMAQAPPLRQYLLQPDAAQQAAAHAIVDSFRVAVGPSIVSVADRRGKLILSSQRNPRDSVIGVDVTIRPYFQQALQGKLGTYFAVGLITKERGYYASAPIYGAGGAGGDIIGASVAKKALDAFEAELLAYRDCYVISPEGIVFLSGRKDMLFRSLWPLDMYSWDVAVKSRQFGAIDPTALFPEEIRDGEWVRLDGRTLLVGRRAINVAGWSLVRLVEAPTTIFNRLFGIAITLLVCTLALVYFVALQRRIDSEAALAAKQGELERLAGLLERQATTDALTGANNRLKFNTLLEDEMKRAERYHSALSLVMYDIDLFKSVNDTYGHLTGDTVLVRLTQLVTANLRQTDTLARWGGEEFMILAPNTDLDAATVLAEKLRALIARSELGAPGRVTCSFAVTQFHAGESFESFTGRTDAALYRAKREGRNRVALAA
jgi:diguanylate cyclase (GGDEF)-like protein